MRRRRREILTDDIKSEVKSVLGSLVFWLFKKLVDRIVKMLENKGWINLSGADEYE